MRRGSIEWEANWLAPWLHADALPEVLPGKRGKHGYLRRHEEGALPKRADGFDALQRAVAHPGKAAPIFAWLPDHQYVRTIYEIDELADAVVGRSRAEAEKAIQASWLRAALAVVLVTAAFVFWPAGRDAQMMILLGTFLLLGPLWVQGVEAFLRALLTKRQVDRAPDRWRRRQSERIRYETWNKGGRSHTGTGLAVASTAVFVLMLVAGRSDAIAALALVKDRVADGELWRLYTCTLMHGSFLHIYFNVLVGLALAATARRLVSETLVLLTFLVAALAGSAASFALTPATSVGASGGILGWAGLLVGLAWVHPDVRRTGVLSNMLRWVVMLALLGVAGMGFIDNAAHAGGFLAGLALGVLFARFGPRMLPLGGNKLGIGYWVLAAPAIAGAVAMGFVLLRM